jgi:hypothetical protein
VPEAELEMVAVGKGFTVIATWLDVALPHELVLVTE